MTTPFEELEYLADYLPDEGEAVLVTRKQGELVCEAFQRDGETPGISDPEFYGRLVQANERLNSAGAKPIWCCLLLLFWACVTGHTLSGFGWSGWYLDVGLALGAVALCFQWIRARQAKLFHREIAPMLNWQLRQRFMDKYVLIGVIRHQPELRTLLDEMVRADDR